MNLSMINKAATFSITHFYINKQFLSKKLIQTVSHRYLYENKSNDS